MARARNQRSFAVGKLNGTQGGLAAPDVLHEQLSAGWKATQAQKIVDQATEAVTRRYRFEDKAR